MHLSLFDTLSAFSNRLFYQRLGWIGDIESYHLIPLLFSSLGIFIVTLFARELTGNWLAGAAGGLSLGLFPLFFADSHMNMKDPIAASLFAGVVWSLWHWTRSNSIKWFIVMTIFVAFSLGGKWSIMTIPFIALPWFFIIRKTAEFKKWFKPIRLIGLVCFAALACFAFLIAIWPTAWADPRRLTWVIMENFNFGLQSVRFQPEGFEIAGFNFYPIMLLLSQTPPVLLLLGAVGLWISVRNAKYHLISLWFFVTLLRFFLPNTYFYGGVRQFMEVLPAVAILVGIGLFKLHKVIVLLISIVFVILITNIIRLHPYQNAYFNIFIGGLPGAVERNLVDWTLTYGSIYREAADWLNANAQLNANVAHLDGTMFSISPIWLRDDISLSPNNFSGFDQKGEYIIALFNPLDPPVFAKRYPEKFLQPIHEIGRDGVVLLRVFRNSPEFVKSGYKNERILAPSVKPVLSPQGSFFAVDLKEPVLVTRVTVQKAGAGCENRNAEFVAFSSNDPRDFYVLNERKRMNDTTVEYRFAAEVASIIKIFPQSDDSCVSGGYFTSVSYLPLSQAPR